MGASTRTPTYILSAAGGASTKLLRAGALRASMHCEPNQWYGLLASGGDCLSGEPPADADIDAMATLKAVLKLGDDTNRFGDDKAAEIVGYAYDVKPGGNETCNCGKTAADLIDTHIELVPSPTLNDKTHRVIVEITPRWREKMAALG